MPDLAWMELLFALLGVAATGGALRQMVVGLRRDHEKAERRIKDLEDRERQLTAAIYGKLNTIERNLHRLMGKLDVDPID